MSKLKKLLQKWTFPKKARDSEGEGQDEKAEKRDDVPSGDPGDSNHNNDDDNKKKRSRQLKILTAAYMLVISLCMIIIATATEQVRGILPENIPETSYMDFVHRVEKNEVDVIFPENPNGVYFYYAAYNDDTRDMDLEERNQYVYADEELRKCANPNYEEFRKDMLTMGVRFQALSVSRTEGAQSMVTVAQTIFRLATLLYIIWLIATLLSGPTWGEIKANVELSASGKNSNLIQTSDVNFSDIIGQDEVLDDIKFITRMIKEPTLGEDVGAKVPHGLLFAGPPGTGKTMIAKAIAHEAGVPFLYQNASSLIEMYVGVGAKRVRHLFKVARENAPCIVFIDEIDAVGRQRGSNRDSTSEHLQTINALLQEMDGFQPHEQIFVIAATNNPESLDDALTRAGRFDRQITINPPRDWMTRRDLFKHYLEPVKVSDDVDLDTLSKQTPGFTGADIAAVCNEAGIVAIMQNKPCVDTACIEEAIDKKIFKGNRAKNETKLHDKTIVAYHEAGHAVMSYLLGEPIARASIQATVSGVGGAVFNEEKDTVFHTKTYLENRIKIAYAGRASEEIQFKEVTTGASNDITQATNLISQYIEQLGFDETFGLLDVNVLAKNHMISDNVISQKMSAMSLRLYGECKEQLQGSYHLVEALAQKLLEEETLSGPEITALFTGESQSLS